MLLKGYRLEIFNNECMPGAISVNCHAHLDQDVSAALPYVNAELGGFQYIPDPPSVTFRNQGKLITIHSHKIAVNALRDEAEARRIVDWLMREINAAWEQHDQIQPRFEGLPRPQVIEILKRLPKTNCRECGQPTCMVFATLMAEGAKSSGDCPAMAGGRKTELQDYMASFGIDL